MTLVNWLHVPLPLISDASRSCWQEEQENLVHRLLVRLALIYDDKPSCWQEGQVVPSALVMSTVRELLVMVLLMATTRAWQF